MSRKNASNDRTPQEAQDETTYEALDFQGMDILSNYRFVGYRTDILHILNKKEGAATIFQIIFRWQQHRREELLVEIERRRKTSQRPLSVQEVEERMWIYMSYNDFVRETGNALGYNTIIRMLKYLTQTVKILEQRENHDPRYPDYEYRINKDILKKLLGTLPLFPVFTPKGTKKYAPEDCTQLGTEENESDSTQLGTDSTQLGTDSTQLGTTSYPSGYNTIPNWGHITVDTESTQITTQISTQQKQSSLENEQQTAAAAGDTLIENLSSEEIALIQAFRQRKTQGSAANLLENVPPTAEVPSEQPQQLEEEPSEEPAETDAALTAERVVQVFEQLRGASYNSDIRKKELAAAETVLRLPLPVTLTVAWLERIHRTYNDANFRQWYGKMEVHHLPQRENKGKGAIRLVRWLERLLAEDEQNTPKTRQEDRQGPSMIEWKGSLVPEEEARRDGYNGGWERFKPGDHPDDDLEAVVARLMAEGKLITGGTSNG